MKTSITVYRLGAMSLLFAGGVFFEEPLHSQLSQNQSTLLSFLLLYGLPVLAGFSFLALSKDNLQSGDKRILHLCNGIAVVSLTWLCLWVSIWSSMMAFPLSLINLAGIGLSALIYGLGWRKSAVDRALWFLMSAGWSLGYMGWTNLYLQPTSKHLWGAAIGGTMVLIGAFLLRGDMDEKKSASSMRVLLY